MVDSFSVGWSAALAVTTVSSDTVLPMASSLLLMNDGSVVCFVRIGGVIQVASISDLPILPGGRLVVSGGVHVAAVTGGGSTVLRVVGGVGRVFGIGIGGTATSPSLLLDQVGGAVAAYSLRKLRTGYGGKAVNVRRSSDNATSDIGFAGNDFDVAGFSAFVGGGTGFVATWYDQVGSQNAVQGTAANQPSVALAISPSGRAAVQGSGQAGLLLSASLTVASTAPCSFACVCDRTGNFSAFNIPIILNGGPSGNNGTGLYYDSSPGGGIGLADYGVAGFVGSPHAADNAWHSVVGVSNFAASSIGIDGTGTAGTINSNAGAVAVHLFSNNGLTTYTGYVAEAIYFGGVVSGANVAIIRGSHQAYYGTP